MFEIPYYKPSILENYISSMVEKPSSAVYTAIETFLNGLETDAILHKFVLFYITCLHTDQVRRTNILRPRIFTLTDTGAAPTSVSGVGGAGGLTATTECLDTNFPWISGWSGPANGDCCVFMDSGTSGQSNVSDFGLTAYVSLNFFVRTTADVSSGRLIDASTETVASGVTDGSGLFGFERVGTDKRVYREGVSIGNVSRAIVLSTNQTIKILGATSPSIRRTRLFAVSYALGSTGQANFHTRWTQFKTDIGCT